MPLVVNGWCPRGISALTISALMDKPALGTVSSVQNVEGLYLICALSKACFVLVFDWKITNYEII